MTDGTSVQSSTLVSDDRLREVLRRELDRAINVERTFTRQQLAVESGVNIHTLDAIISRDPGKQRRVNGGVALSLACVLGKRCVNAILATIGYQGAPLDEAEEIQPCAVVGGIARGLAVIAAAASDNRIDHTERPGVTDAADLIIATVMPYSRAGQAA
jgi:hypothetical protein